MQGLWSDRFFYASGVGFFVSLGLMGWLRSQYRMSLEHMEHPEPDEPPRIPVPVLAPAPVSAKPVPLAPSPAKPAADKTLLLAPESAPKAAPAPTPAPSPEPKPVAPDSPTVPPPVVASAPPAAPAPVAPVPVAPAPAVPPVPAPLAVPIKPRDPATTTGGISPAVVMIQGMKNQIDGFDKDIAGLKSLLNKQGAQLESVLMKLSEMVNSPVKASPAAQPTPVPAPVPVAIPAPAPVSVQVSAPSAVPPPAVVVPAATELKAPGGGKTANEILFGLAAVTALTTPGELPTQPAAPQTAVTAPISILTPESFAALPSVVLPASAPPASVIAAPAPSPAEPSDATVKISPPPVVLEQLPQSTTSPGESAPPTRKGPVWPI